VDSNIQNRTIALAALFQCVEGVTQLANNGTVNQALLETCINSILNEDADTAVDLYGSLSDLEVGFKSMLHQLGTGQLTPDGKPKDMEATRYSLGLLHLENKLNKNADVFSRLIDGIKETQEKLAFFEAGHDNIVARLAELYANTISTMAPKIIVKGDQSYLSKPENAAKIRTLLLAGIRAALLWRQAGGNRWKLLLERGKLQRQADDFLKQI